MNILPILQGLVQVTFTLRSLLVLSGGLTATFLSVEELDAVILKGHHEIWLRN